jgi:hypothetical protein
MADPLPQDAPPSIWALIRSLIVAWTNAGNQVTESVKAMQASTQEAADAMKSAQSSLDTALGDFRKNAAEITAKVKSLPWPL